MAGKEWYRDWFSSPFYHKLYFDRDEAEAGRFIDNLVQKMHPPVGSRMLDAGCGKGRHALYLAQKGHDVTGIDISFESIEFANKNLVAQAEPGHLQFFQHDMRLPFWVNYYDYVFNFFTSFGYFRTRREHDDALRTLAGSLRTGGTILIDYLNVHYAENILVANEIKTVEQTRYEIHRWQEPGAFHKRMIITDPGLDTPLEYEEVVAKFSLGDFTDMLSFQKMQVKEVFGDYDLGPYHTHDTPRMIIIAEKMR